MAPYRIFIDASADIDPAVRDRYGIEVVPLPYSVDGEHFTCTGFEDDAFRRSFYEAEKNGAVPKTSAASPQAFLDRFGPVLDAGESVLYIALSSGLSGTCNSAAVAAEQLNERGTDARVVVVDSLSASAGEAMMAEEAAIRREQGLGLAENAAWLEANKGLQQHWFMVDDLLYLRRGGRVSAAAALVGTALAIKPILTVAPDGTLAQFEKRRGSRAGMKRLLEHAEASLAPSLSRRAYVTHCNNEPGAAFLAERLQAMDPEAQVSVCNMLPFIGSHVGPGLVSVFNWGSEEHRRGTRPQG